MRKNNVNAFLFSMLSLLLLIGFVTAATATEYVLNVNVQGGGWVETSPPGSAHQAGTEVTLIAHAGPGFKLSRWDGDLSGGGATQAITMDENKNISVIFLQTYVRRVEQNTNYGMVIGKQDIYSDPVNSNISYNALSWLGIPYAKPPIGELRWKAPQDPDSWKEYKEVKTQPNVCIQLPINTTEVIGSEDSLYLNIFRPYTYDDDLPVYVWIHGGANQMDGARTYDLRNFAAKANVVAVVVQFRLGEVGFFTHPALRKGESPADDSGNYGLLDQIKALEWVRDNIEYFGGNPSNVTVAGQSAGASNILALMTSPLATGLFHKVQYQSGGLSNNSKAYMDERTGDYLAALGIDPASGDEAIESSLRSVGAADLIAARPFGHQFGSIIDGYVLTDIPLNRIISGDYTEVPIMLGGVKDEMTIYSHFLTPYTPIFNASYGFSIPDFSNLLPMVINGVDIYTGNDYFPPISCEDMNSFIAANDILSRMWVAKHTHLLAESLRAYQEDVYVYSFNWDGKEGSDHQAALGADHGLEIFFFFGGGYSDKWGISTAYTTETKAGGEALERIMVEYNKAFIHTGNPNSPARPAWEAWSNDAGSSKSLILDASGLQDDPTLSIYMDTNQWELPVLWSEVWPLQSLDRKAFDMIMVYSSFMKFK